MPPSSTNAVHYRMISTGERQVQLRLYGRSSRNFCTPTGVFNARKVRNSDRVKPSVSIQSLSSNALERSFPARIEIFHHDLSSLAVRLKPISLQSLAFPSPG